MGGRNNSSEESGNPGNPGSTPRAVQLCESQRYAQASAAPTAACFQAFATRELYFTLDVERTTSKKVRVSDDASEQCAERRGRRHRQRSPKSHASRAGHNARPTGPRTGHP